MKNQKSKIFKIFLVFLITYNLQLTMLSSLYAKDDKKLVDLSKQVIEAKAPDALYAPLEEIKQIYFKDNKYSEFVEFLKSLAAKKKTLEPFTNYYIALSRYQQLKYLEEKQLWDEYFAQGNTYRDELTTAAQKTIDTTSPKEPLNIYSRLILWQFHRDQQDAFNEQALAHLMGSVSEYAKEAKNFQVIKEVADKLSGYQEKAKAKELYRLYVNKLISSGISDAEVKSAALSFYKGNQLDLAEGLYDVYIGRIIETEKKEKVIPVLLGLAKDFAYQDDGPSDPFYAEKIFQKIEELGGKDIFNEELIYLRAFNLEKAKEYPAAKDAYLKLVERFPGTSHADEAEYKIAIIYT